MKDTETLKDLFLYMYKQLNGHNLSHIGNTYVFDLEFKDYCFTFDLTKNTIKLNTYVEVLKDDNVGDFRECKDVFNTKL
jgi:hypothetical protein